MVERKGLTSPAAIRFMTSSCSRRICFGSGPAVDCMLSMLYMYARARVDWDRAKTTRRDSDAPRPLSRKLQFSAVRHLHVPVTHPNLPPEFPCNPPPRSRITYLQAATLTSLTRYLPTTMATAKLSTNSVPTFTNNVSMFPPQADKYRGAVVEVQ